MFKNAKIIISLALINITGGGNCRGLHGSSQLLDGENIIHLYFVCTLINIIGGQVSGAARFQPTFGWNEYSATATALNMVANRISFFLNLTGPSVTYDTACSGMMTALHGAHASLTQHECKLGILVGSVVHFGHAHNPSFNQLGVLSPDGGCHSFDDSANGCIFTILNCLLRKCGAFWVCS